MAIRQQEVIRRLKAGETLLCTLPTGNTESDKAVYYLSGGGQSHHSDLSQAYPGYGSCFARPVCRGGSARVAVV